MFVTDTTFDTNSHCTSFPRPPPSSRFATNPPQVVSPVLPLDIAGYSPAVSSQSLSPANATAAIGFNCWSNSVNEATDQAPLRKMSRRGSHTANMLRPTAKIVQAVQQQADGLRRLSDPTLNSNRISNQGPAAAQQVRPMGASAVQAHSVQFGAPQPRTNFARAHAFGQQATTHSTHSTVSSMDLMMPSNFSAHAQGNISSNAPAHSLFNSSSHHTSHTAAAGDLLTMSRRALDPSRPIDQKKRTASDDSNGQTINSNTNMIGGSSQTAGQYFTGPLHAPHQGHVRGYNSMDMSDLSYHQQPSFLNALSPATTEPTALSTDGSSGSTSASCAMGGIYNTEENDESYQHHRTTRRCRRSDSFEMMDS